MPGQDGCCIVQRQLCQQGEAFLHLLHTATREIRAPAGACKQRVAAEQQPVAGQADAAPGVAGRVIDFKRQLIDGKLVVRGPVVGEDVGRQRQKLAARKRGGGVKC